MPLFSYLTQKSSVSKSHVASSPTLLSVKRNALTCSSVKSSATRQGTVCKPNFFAALYLVCPATITPCLSMTIGCLNPIVVNLHFVSLPYVGQNKRATALVALSQNLYANLTLSLYHVHRLKNPCLYPFKSEQNRKYLLVFIIHKSYPQSANTNKLPCTALCPKSTLVISLTALCALCAVHFSLKPTISPA